MNKDETSKVLMNIADIYGKELSTLNLQTMNFLSSAEGSELLKAYSDVMKGLYSINTLKMTAQTTVKSIIRIYDGLLGKYNEELKKSLSEFQVNTMFLLSQSYKTTMVKDLISCFVNSDYVAIIQILNDALKKSRMFASDVAFLRMSELDDILKKEIRYPKGFKSSIRLLNKATAADISDKGDLSYDTESNCFISNAGRTDSTGLNIICSGKTIFSSGSEDLFTENELINFMSYLSELPTLALSNETGKKIFDWLKNLYEERTYTIDFDRNNYFHCRSRKREDAPFTFSQMLMAPTGLPWAGRFNHVGRSNYYFADTRKGAEAEVKKHLTNDDVLQTAELCPIKSINLLDLSGTLARGATFLRYIRFNLSDMNDKMPREYLIPCFVSDCCKRIGFDGIKYYGSKEYSNYVTWNAGYFGFVTMFNS